MTTNVISTLKERGLLEAVTSPDVEKAGPGSTAVYAGFDPSSDSLQVGNLVAVLGLAHFQRCGYKVVAVVGGATGLIGDPSGKTADREFLSNEDVERNLVGIRENLSRFLDFDDATAGAVIVNNNDWMKEFTFVDFLRDIGRNFRLGTMLNKESVRARLDSEEGMSFAEFSYQLLQGYDFLHLYDAENCRIQVGGSDQWGNITAGIDLIHKLRGAEAYGVTFPLVCDSMNRKLGKSEEGAIYLDQGKTSYYDFYQFFIRTSDEDVVRFLKMFTYLPVSEIAELENQLREAPEQRQAQQRLAEELTRTVHGQHGLDVAAQATAVLFGGSMEGLDAADLIEIFSDVPSKELPGKAVVDVLAIDVAVACGMCKSKSEARRLVDSGGLYVNNVRAADANATVQAADIVSGRILVMRSGKRNFHLVKIV